MRAEVVLLVSFTAFIPASLTVAADVGPAAPTRFASSRPGEIVVPVTVGGLGPFRFLLDTGSTHTAVTDRLATAADAVPVARTVMRAAAGSVGLATCLSPLIDQMNPSADVLALASIEVDVSSVQPGQTVTFTWRSHPLFVRRRTPAEIEAAKAVKPSDLLDPLARNAALPENALATDANRSQKPEWLVVVGVCTHLGCTPQASTMVSKQGDYGGCLCHCHGSQYDVAGRVRVGPAPQNLHVPDYALKSPTTVQIG